MVSIWLGILIGLGLSSLLGAFGKAFADWAKVKWFGGKKEETK